MLDLITSWGVTSAEFDKLVGPILRVIYREKLEKRRGRPPKKVVETYPYIKPQQLLSKIEEDIVKGLEAGKSLGLIAQELGVTKNTVRRRAEKVGINVAHLPKPKHRIPAKPRAKKPHPQDENIASSIEAGRSLQQIARKLNLPLSTVKYRAKALGIDFEQKRQSKHRQIVADRRAGMTLTQLSDKYLMSTKQIIQICQKHDLDIQSQRVQVFETRDSQILSALRAGRSKESIAEEFKISPERVRKIANAHGVTTGPVEKQRAEKRKLIEEALRANEPVKAIARRLKVDRKTVQNVKRRLNKPKRNPGKSGKLKKVGQKGTDFDNIRLGDIPMAKKKSGKRKSIKRSKAAKKGWRTRRRKAAARKGKKSRKKKLMAWKSGRRSKRAKRRSKK